MPLQLTRLNCGFRSASGDLPMRVCASPLLKSIVDEIKTEIQDMQAHFLLLATVVFKKETPIGCSTLTVLQLDKMLSLSQTRVI